MSVRRNEPAEVLPSKPFSYGMMTAFDIYGVSGHKMHVRIREYWRSILDQTRKSSEEALREDIALVNSEYQTLLKEHED